MNTNLAKNSLIHPSVSGKPAGNESLTRVRSFFTKRSSIAWLQRTGGTILCSKLSHCIGPLQRVAGGTEPTGTHKFASSMLGNEEGFSDLSRNGREFVVLSLFPEISPKRIPCIHMDLPRFNTNFSCHLSDLASLCVFPVFDTFLLFVAILVLSFRVLTKNIVGL